MLHIQYSKKKKAIEIEKSIEKSTKHLTSKLPKNIKNIQLTL